MTKKILVVDDEPDILSMLSEVLEANDYKVSTASDGIEGFKKAVEEKPDLILLDIIMPKRDGFKMLMDLKREESTKSIPVVILSAKGEIDSLEDGELSGAADYIIKPYTADRLLKYVRRYLLIADDKNAI